MKDEVLRLSELSYVRKTIDSAINVQDIFGNDASTIDQRFNDFRIILEKFPTEKATNQKLGFFYNKAKKAIKDSNYEYPLPLYDEVKLKVNGNECILKKPIAKTVITNTYYGTYAAANEDEQAAIIKIATGVDEVGKKAHSNALVTEAKTLKELWKDREEPNLRHLPELLSQFVYNKAQVNVLSYTPGYDMHRFLSSPYHVGGMNDIHIAWVMSRILTTLGFVHDSGFIHGGLTPDCFVIAPEDHNVTITDWTRAVRANDKITEKPPVYSPDDEHPTPSTDIYSLGKCMVYLSGGNPATGEINPKLPNEFQNLFKWMTLESPLQRPRDAYALAKDLREIRTALHGVRRFFHTTI